MKNLIETWQLVRRSMQILGIVLGYRLFEYLPSGPLRFALNLVSFFTLRRWNKSIQEQDLPSRTRHAFQELGPVSIKMGQMLSTRHDLLNPHAAAALSHLQDKMPYFPTAVARSIIEDSFGLTIDKLFSRFDEEPLAAASIAQIHTAKLSTNASPDGHEHEVIIKVIRPGIVKMIKRETQAMKTMARLMTKLFPALERFHIKQVVEDYEKTILEECDLRHEAANTQRFGHEFKDSPLLYVPKIYSPWVQEQVFIMERVSGLPVNDIEGLEKAGVDLKQLSEIGATIFLTQVFKNNFYHADMHPGNILVDISDPRNPRYIALDCAIAGTLEPRDHRLLTRQLLALIKQDYLRLSRLLITGRWVPADTNRLALANALEEVCSPILSKPLSEIEFGPLLANLFSTARHFELQALPQFVLLEKTLLHVEGLGRQLDPNLDIWSLGQPLLTKWLRDELLSPENACNAQSRVMNAVEKMPEALEDWYDEQMGVRQSASEAIGERLKRLEGHIQGQQKQQKRAFYGAGLLAVSYLITQFDTLQQIPVSALIIGAAGLWYLKPKKQQA